MTKKILSYGFIVPFCFFIGHTASISHSGGRRAVAKLLMCRSDAVNEIQYIFTGFIQYIFTGFHSPLSHLKTAQIQLFLTWAMLTPTLLIVLYFHREIVISCVFFALDSLTQYLFIQVYLDLTWNLEEYLEMKVSMLPSPPACASSLRVHPLWVGGHCKQEEES